MARQHVWQDRAQIMRVVKRVSRGEVMGEAPAPIGAPISCILVNISGREAPMDARTYMPENALLHFLPKDTVGVKVDAKQGDTVIIFYIINGVRQERGTYKIVSDIKPNRRGSELVSYTAEVRDEREH